MSNIKTDGLTDLTSGEVAQIQQDLKLPADTVAAIAGVSSAASAAQATASSAQSAAAAASTAASGAQTTATNAATAASNAAATAGTALGAANAAAAQVETRAPKISINPGVSFDDIVAGMTRTHAWVFGSAATAGAGETAVTNSTQLNAAFDFHPHSVLPYVINCEPQDYQPFSASANFVFGPDHLKLQATCATSVACLLKDLPAVSTAGRFGVPVPLSDWGITSGDGIVVGQVVLRNPVGGGYVSAIDATNITVQAFPSWISAGVGQSGGMAAWTPARVATLASALSDTATTVSLVSAPAGIVAGMHMAEVRTDVDSLKRYFQGVDVVSVAGNTITLSAPFGVALASGAKVAFIPAVKSGQIVSRDLFDEPGLNQAIAFELECDLPTNGSASDIRGLSSVAAYTAASGSTQPFGGWPASWLYGDVQDWSTLKFKNSSEVDVFEGWFNLGRGLRTYSSWGHNSTFATHSIQEKKNQGSARVVVGPDGTGGRSVEEYGFVDFPANINNATCKIQCVWVLGRLQMYFNGEFQQRMLYDWAASTGGRWMVNLACGSYGAQGNLDWFSPLTAAGLANLGLKIRRMRVWKA